MPFFCALVQFFVSNTSGTRTIFRLRCVYLKDTVWVNSTCIGLPPHVQMLWNSFDDCLGNFLWPLLLVYEAVAYRGVVSVKTYGYRFEVRAVTLNDDTVVSEEVIGRVEATAPNKASAINMARANPHYSHVFKAAFQRCEEIGDARVSTVLMSASRGAPEVAQLETNN